MNILYYCWHENSAGDIISYWEKAGYHYTKITASLKSYDTDEAFEQQVSALLEQSGFDLIFTFDYFPVLSKIADISGIPYAAWIYDCPHLTLYSTLAASTHTYFFLFDSELCETMKQLGAAHVFYLPLAVNVTRLEQLFHLADSSSYDNNSKSGSAKNSAVSPEFFYPVSFVGSLYENNSFRHIGYLPEQLHGYLDGILNAQLKVGGSALLPELLTDSLLSELCRFVQIETPENYRYSKRTIIQTMLEAEITCRERMQLLHLLSGFYETHLFTGSDVSFLPDCNTHGYVSYLTEMPLIFRQSAINLNISLRSIHSGIPLRCLDIMGAGGFLLSNPQPELCTHFSPDEEFVFYSCPEDLINKISYYTEHKTKRLEIAHNGYEKIKAQFCYEVLFEEIIARSC